MCWRGSGTDRWLMCWPPCGPRSCSPPSRRPWPTGSSTAQGRSRRMGVGVAVVGAGRRSCWPSRGPWGPDRRRRRRRHDKRPPDHPGPRGARGIPGRPAGRLRAVPAGFPQPARRAGRGGEQLEPEGRFPGRGPGPGPVHARHLGPVGRGPRRGRHQQRDGPRGRAASPSRLHVPPARHDDRLRPRGR